MNFLKSPLSNGLSIILTVIVVAAMLFAPGSLASPDLAPLSLAGSGITTFDSVTLNGDLAVTGNASITGTNTFATGSVSAGEIADVVRAINLPLFSWIDCTTNAGAAIGFDATADALPDFVNSSTDGLGFQIAWDDTGGSLDTGYVCNTVQIPANYVSGGALTLVMGKDAQTTNAEFVNCQGSINGAALGTVGTTAVSTSTVASYTCSPTLTGLAAGNSLGLAVYVTATTAIDDITSIYSVDFTYTATQ